MANPRLRTGAPARYVRTRRDDTGTKSVHHEASLCCVVSRRISDYLGTLLITSTTGRHDVEKHCLAGSDSLHNWVPSGMYILDYSS